MSSSQIKERVRTLEADLKASPMRHHVYHDLPFAIFCYPPEQEWAMRHETDLLKTRLENDTQRQVAFISLAELLWQAIDESEGIEAVAGLERRDGFEAAQLQVNDYLSDPDWRPLPDLLAERLAELNPDRHIAFIVRAGALAPNIYRVSKLLDEMKGRTRVPCVLFMPATTEGRTSLRFMGIAENEGRGSYHTKVYA
ncbi:MAG: DUF1788 domain-containing protein [Chloroflexi bacterium]|nr:MAG: DUF1788 domain-containing protein [Chloroflexota bacterium]RLC76420.1 MAG: DUF1788 domain-containing protein [Chloroflexota bacterium]HEY74000.1 DUF1788 domain-containing protein [Thermoflexia bacterium]